MQKFTALMVLGSGLTGACGSDDTSWPYAADQTTIIGDAVALSGPTGYHVESTPDGEACIELNEACVTPQEQCGDNGVADVLVDAHGAAVDVICYPTGGVAIEHVEGDLADVGNNVVLVLDDAPDGVDVAGDITIDGNNVTLFGYGPDVSVVGGNLNIDKNNALVRGLRVAGDVTIDKNNPSIVDCVIEGDLTIRGNNVSVALCDVWGKLTIEGNNAILVGNHFASAPEIFGLNTVCNGNVAFDDENADGELGADELGDAIECGTPLETQ